MKSRKVVTMVVAKGEGKMIKITKKEGGEKKKGRRDENGRKGRRGRLHLGSRGFDATRPRQYAKERKRRINCISVAVGPGRHDEI